MNQYYPKFFNQNSFIITREKVETQKKGETNYRPFVCAYQDNLLAAMRDLDGTSIKVYLLFLCNANGFTLDYSPQYVSQQTGISRDSARKAIQKMKQKGYISSELNDQGKYTFYEKPQPVKKRQLASSQPPEGQSHPNSTWE